MRPVLLIIAAVAAFFALDLVANNGRFTAQVERSYHQAAASTGPAGLVTFNN
jgi:hypothetical protein